MAISMRVSDYLEQQQISFEVIVHQISASAKASAISSNVVMRKVVKAVVLEDHDDKHMMALLPSDHAIDLQNLGRQLHCDLHLLEENKIQQRFSGCVPGAIPPMPMAFNMDSVVDEQLLSMEDVYLEAGDHEHLIHLGHDDFMQLVKNSKHLRFAQQIH